MSNSSRMAVSQDKFGSEQLRKIVNSYESLIIRTYCLIRFRIIRGRFLEEIAQFLPARGAVLEVGCGFGLFGICFAQANPELKIYGIDRNEGRIKAAENARTQLGISNLSLCVGDAQEFSFPEELDAIYMLDILHHLPPSAAVRLLRACRSVLRHGSVLIIKEVDTRPRYKTAFTWMLDVIMTGGERPIYWSRWDLVRELRETGFEVFSYAMLDALPYPHQLYVCHVPNLGETTHVGNPLCAQHD